MYYKQQIYQPDVYDDSVITKNYAVEFASLTGMYFGLVISKQSLESEETFDGFGINPREAEFFVTSRKSIDY